MLKKFLIVNSRVFIFWGALGVAGYCFGGKIGLGVVALLFAIITAL